jgi:hypothetical protein
LVLPLLFAGCKPNPQNGTATSKPENNPSRDHGALTVTPPIPARPEDFLADVSQKAGLTFIHQYCDNRIANILESNGAGGAVLDYDNDGLPDIFLISSGPLAGVTHHAPGTPRQPNRLYHNLGQGRFEEVTEKAGVGGTGFGFAAVAADYDNDGFTDLYVVNVGKNNLYHNRGNGTFEEVTDKAGVGDTGTGIAAVFTDVDNDGKLDLFVANYLTYDPNYNLYFNPDSYPGPLSYKPECNVLYRNRGDGTFENISEAAGVHLTGHRAMSVAAIDFDQDGDQDLYISNDGTPNSLLVNDGKGHFKDLALAHGVAFNALGEAAGSMAAAVGDYNNDLLPDILVTRLGYGSLYQGASNGFFTDRMMASGLGQLTAEYVGWGGAFLDFDNDRDADVVIANGDAHHLVGWESLLLENTGTGTFINARDKGGAFFSARIRARGCAVLDFNNDGRMDVLITAIGDRCFLLENQGRTPNHWLTVNLEGTRSNRDGFGARVRVVTRQGTLGAEARCAMGFLTMGDRRLHFGLGADETVDRLEIRWPSGTVQTLTGVKADQVLKVREQ